MPMHIRRYCLKLIKDTKEKENAEIEKSKSSSKSSGGTPKIPSQVGTAYNKQKATQRRTPPAKKK